MSTEKECHRGKKDFKQVKTLLESGTMHELYKKTYNSLKERITANGYFEESLTGAYHGMFCRSVGAFASLMFETGEYEPVERTLQFVIINIMSNDYERVPHVIGANGDCNMDDQIDGQAHVILAWARLALLRGRTEFEDATYPIIKKLMDRSLDQPYFFYGSLPWSNHALKLVFNVSFEHSREGRRWHAFDLLTQCFVGAAAEEMIKVAQRRNEYEKAALWNEKLKGLKEGVKNYLTGNINGEIVYLEMRLPDSDWGVPYEGLSWVNLSPVAAQWEPLDRSVLRNTMRLLRQKLWMAEPSEADCGHLATEYNPDGRVNDFILGKSVGWDLEFARQEGDYEHIVKWLNFLLKYHKDTVYMEYMERNADKAWKINDHGNGEQCCWWCWAISRLRREVGLTAEP